MSAASSSSESNSTSGFPNRTLSPRTALVEAALQSYVRYMSDITWVKSSRSQQDGACVEVADWRKSSRSQGEGGGDCVEVASVQR